MTDNPFPAPNVVVVGPLPPPVNGFAAVTREVHTILSRRAIVSTVNTSPTADGRQGAWRLARAFHLLCQWVQFLWRVARAQVKPQTMYLAVSGAHGQLVDILWIVAARSLRLRVCAHHHSFAYLDRPTATSRLLMFASHNSIHVALCSRMKMLIRDRYSIKDSRIIVLSNAAFVESGADREARPEIRRTDRGLTVGFLSAVTREKGADTFVQIASQALKSGAIGGALVAGPNDPALVEELSQAVDHDPRIRFLGPVYGEAKERFFAAIDVLLFPSRYANEAEPLVVLEAMRAGVPVIATDRGCIPDMLGEGLHATVASDGDFFGIAIKTLERLAVDRSRLQAAREAAAIHYRRKALDARADLDRLLDGLLQSPSKSA